MFWLNMLLIKTFPCSACTIYLWQLSYSYYCWHNTVSYFYLMLSENLTFSIIDLKSVDWSSPINEYYHERDNCMKDFWLAKLLLQLMLNGTKRQCNIWKMGNTTSSISGSERSKGGSNKVWVLLHKTWTIMVTEKLTSRFSHKSRLSEKSDFQSQYSICSCSHCQRDDEEFSSGCYRLVVIY